jgi:hypothetical protein
MGTDIDFIIYILITEIDVQHLNDTKGSQRATYHKTWTNMHTCTDLIESFKHHIQISDHLLQPCLHIRESPLG